jgi:hypothetical protein
MDRRRKNPGKTYGKLNSLETKKFSCYPSLGERREKREKQLEGICNVQR